LTASPTPRRALGESSGTKSYHLRKLAEQRLVEEIPERSGGGERWWRLLPIEHVMVAPSERTLEEDSALAEWNSQRLSADIDLYIRALTEYEGPDGWVQAQRTGTLMTKDGVHAFYAEYLDLLRKHSYSEELAPPGARRMAIRFFAIPEADPPTEVPAAIGCTVERWRSPSTFRRHPIGCHLGQPAPVAEAPQVPVGRSPRLGHI
jgi:hypothetical protein